MMRTSVFTPEDFARALLEKFGVAVNLFELAHLIGLKIKEVDSDSFEGALIRVPNKPQGIIALKSSVQVPGRKRFTLAHEIGHYVLPDHGSLQCVCHPKNIESWRSGVPEQEVAANRFAAELLLPSAIVLPIVHKKSASISTAKFLKEQHQSSLTAAARKCVELTSEKCAIVYSTGGRIEWCSANGFFGYFITKGKDLHPDTLAAQLFQKSGDREREGSVSGEAWLSQYSLRVGARIWEDSIALPSFDSVLTILTITEPISP